MGVPVEGWDKSRIATKYGLLQDLQPRRGAQSQVLPPGTTEDGMERQKYMYLAIIEKQDRITADDLVGTWLKVMTNEKLEGMKQMTEQFDRDLMEIARSRHSSRTAAWRKGLRQFECTNTLLSPNRCD